MALWLMFVWTDGAVVAQCLGGLKQTQYWAISAANVSYVRLIIIANIRA